MPNLDFNIRDNKGRFVSGSVPESFKNGWGWNRGKHHSLDTKIKISESQKGMKNHSWKGDKPLCKECGIRLLSYVGIRCVQHRILPADFNERIKNAVPRGENHYNWNPNRAKVTHNRRNDGEYKQWRLKVFAQDGYRCLWCGEYGKINADHIFSWKEFPMLRYVVDNGQTLCENCHKIKTKSQLKGDGILIFNY